MGFLHIYGKVPKTNVGIVRNIANIANITTLQIPYGGYHIFKQFANITTSQSPLYIYTFFNI